MTIPVNPSNVIVETLPTCKLLRIVVIPASGSIFRIPNVEAEVPPIIISLPTPH